MPDLKRPVTPPRPAQATTPTALRPPVLPKVPSKLLLVDFRSGEAVCDHPEVVSYLREGWQIKSAVPRLVESEGTKLLVVLTKSPLSLHTPLSLTSNVRC